MSATAELLVKSFGWLLWSCDTPNLPLPIDPYDVALVCYTVIFAGTFWVARCPRLYLGDLSG